MDMYYTSIVKLKVKNKLTYNNARNVVNCIFVISAGFLMEGWRDCDPSNSLYCCTSRFPA